jgi:MSHA biogenesis protein MshN
MSLINNMLQDLDRRRALGLEDETSGVRAPPEKPRRREWFWYTLAVLMALTLSWVGWVAYQLMPRPVATKLALSLADEARARPKPVSVIPVSVVQPPAPEPVQPSPPAPTMEPPPQVPPAPQSSVKPFEVLRLAQQIETPVIEKQPPTVAPRETPKTKAKAARPTPSVGASTAPAKETAKGNVDKFDRAHTGSNAKPNYFSRAVVLLNQGRIAEAEQHLSAALQADPSNAAARQTYVSLLLEQQRVEPARRVLQEGLAVTPGHPEFALALARIHTERREYAAALQVMDKAGAAASNGDFQALRGAVLQRMGRHAQAVEAYQNALRSGLQPATTWLGFAISLEALGRKPEAAQAYQRALNAGPLASEAREYAETRARAIQ